MVLHSVVRSFARIANAGGAAVLGIAVLAGCEGGSTGLPNATSNSSPSPSPSAAPTASAPANSGGQLVVSIPTPAPVVCSPAPVSVPVGQTVVIDCTSLGYSGAFTTALGNPAVAAVALASGTYTFFYVSGLQPGSTTLTLTFAAGGAGSEAITVTP